MAKKISDSMIVDGHIEADSFVGSGAGLTDLNVSISSLNVTGVPSSSTYLRGDGTWAVGAGGSGGTATEFIHNQSIPSDIWTIHHGLDKYPTVVIVDSAGSVFLGDVKYIDSNTVTVTFTSSFGGKAYLT